MDPNEFIKKIKLKIKKEWKLAFLATFILGIIIHLYIMTNNFPNHDGLYSIFASQNNMHNGRCFLMAACSISSFFNLPWVIGVLSIIYLSITSVIVVELFDIKNKLSIILVSAIMVSFPTIASGFTYIFMMDGFMLALLLSALSVLLTHKYKYGFLAGAVAICLSIGIYQAYLSFAILLCILKILFDIPIKKEKKDLLIEILKSIAMVVLGFLLYYVALKILLKVQNMQLSNYQGVDSLQSFSLSGIPMGIYYAYRGFVGFIVKTEFFRSNILILICNLAVIISLAYTYIANYIKSKSYKNMLKNALIVAIVLVIPIATNIIKLLSTSTYYHLLMCYHWCLLYIALIILIEKNCEKNIIKWVSVISLICIVFNFYIITNIAYFNVEQKFEKSYALGLRIVDRLEMCEEYKTGMKVAILGQLSEDYYPATSITKEVTEDITGSDGENILFDPFHYESLFKNYFQFTIKYATQEEMNKVIETNEFKEMPNWPSLESLKVINGVMIVKLSNV